jgi:hypothetical protein
VAAVVGIPYRACRQAGVIVVAHEDGTASDEMFVAATLDFMGIETTIGLATGEVILEQNQFPDK